ncbi:MAG TPA: hypothetical protein VFT29_07835 [Gemmatimonadaceae bacterium]|nr:hypothetical protein [Gemmatimonadaceae bacterium]
MRLVPDPFSLAWMATLADDELLDAEVRLRARFGLLEQRELMIRGHKHALMRGPDDLMETWDLWNRLLFATHERKLMPRPEPIGGELLSYAP